MAERPADRSRGAGARERHALLELTLARLREFLREPGAVFWVFGFPLILAVGLGIAFRSRPPEKLHVAVDAALPEAARVAEMLSKTGRVKVRVLSSKLAAAGMRRGRFAMVVGPAPSGSAKTAGATKRRFVLRFDPKAPASAAVRLAVADALQRGYGRSDVVTLVDVAVTERGARYIDFLIPGLIGLNLMGSSLWGLGYRIVQARQHKLLKRYAATPMHRSHYLLSFGLSRLVFLVAEVGLLLAFGALLFDVSVKGSLLSLGAVALVGGASFSGLALLIAARPRTTEGVSGWMNFVMLPMWLLSGSFFSYERFPEAVRPLIKLLPLTALNDALRAVINHGASLLSTLPQLGLLAAWGLVGFVIAAKIFRWK